MTARDAPTNYIQANGNNIAYRRLGPKDGIPLVMMMHFRGNMDLWDPKLLDALARSRPIIIFDNTGVGRSGGEIPTTLKGWAVVLLDLVDALGIPQFDLLGFSMGGGAAQFVALAAPKMVRRLILAGTRTSGMYFWRMFSAEKV
jgi:pimeloyl-ACP methyl ester carboxylesterase